MLEIPQFKTLSFQEYKELNGKKVVKVSPPTYIHKLACFDGDPKDYPKCRKL
jgi:hypothetical protein